MSDLDDEEVEATRKYHTSNASNLKEYETLNILSDDIVGYAVGHERYEEAVKDLVQMYRELKEKYSVAKTTKEEALILESELRKENENLKERNQYLEESDWAWHELLKMQNKREYRSKFLKEFQKEYGKNVLPDYDEIYKRYDKLKKESEELKEELELKDKQLAQAQNQLVVSKIKYSDLVHSALDTCFGDLNEDVELLCRRLYNQGIIKRDDNFYYNPVSEEPLHLSKRKRMEEKLDE